jgi:hypothetical protein
VQAAAIAPDDSAAAVISELAAETDQGNATGNGFSRETVMGLPLDRASESASTGGSRFILLGDDDRGIGSGVDGSGDTSAVQPKEGLSTVALAAIATLATRVVHRIKEDDNSIALLPSINVNDDVLVVVGLIVGRAALVERNPFNHYGVTVGG